MLKAMQLVMTCPAYPEQYDAFYAGKQMAYLRVRHGVFSVYFPDLEGEEIYYTDEINGDGSFEDAERDHFLNIAKQTIMLKLHQHEETRESLDST